MEQNTQGSSFPKVSRGFEQISYKVMLVLTFVLPLFVIPSSSFPFQFGKVILVSLGALLVFSLWIISRLRSGNVDLPKNLIFSMAGLILLFSLISTLFSGAIGESFVGVGGETDTFFFTLVLFALMFVSFKMFTQRKRVLGFYFALFLSSVVLVIYHLLRVFLGADFLTFGVLENTSSALLGRWNDLAIFSGLSAFVSVVTLKFFKPSKKLKIFLYLSMVLSVLLMLAVNSFISWFVLGLLSLVLFVYLFFRSNVMETESNEIPNKKSKISKLAVALFVVSVLAMIFQSQIGVFVNEKYSISQIEARPSFGSTLGVARDVLTQSPGFGAGPNRFSIEWGESKPVEVNNSIFWNIDFNYGIGFVPTSLVTNGVLGFVSWVLFLGALLFLGIRILFAEIRDGASRFIPVSSFLATLFLWIFSIVTVPGSVVLVITFVMTGVFLASAQNMGHVKSKRIHFTDDSRTGFVSVFVMILILIVNLSLGYLITTRYLSAIYSGKAIASVNIDGNLNEGLERINKALFFAKADSNYRLASQVHLRRLNDLLGNQELAGTEEGTEQFQQILGEAISHAQLSTEADGADYRNWLALGNIYEAITPLQIPGAFDNARATYERAGVANPTNPSIDLSLARLEVLNENNEEARVFLDTALQKKSNYTEAIFLLSQIEINEGNITEATQAVEAASVIDPNNPLTFFQLGFLKFSQSDNEGAIQALERAVLLNNIYSNAKYFLGLAYYNVGRVEESLSQFTDVEKLNPENEEVKQILQNLRDGNSPLLNITDSNQVEGVGSLPLQES